MGAYKNPGVNRPTADIWLLPPPQVHNRSTRDPAAASPPPTQRAAESRARLSRISDRQGACAATVRTRAERPAEALQNRFGPPRAPTRAHKQPQPTAAACLKKRMRPTGNRQGSPHFAATAIKKCRRAGFQNKQKSGRTGACGSHLLRRGLPFRPRSSSTLQSGA